MFFVPAEPDQTSFKIPKVYDGIMNTAFRNSPEYKLLLHLNKFYKNIPVRSQIVTLVKEELDFATDPKLAKAGTFFNNYHKSKVTSSYEILQVISHKVHIYVTHVHDSRKIHVNFMSSHSHN